MREGKGNNMTASILKMRRSSPGRIECSACGAATDAACGCGAPYVTAKERAKVAVAAHPEMSDRAIAAEIGVTHPTVAEARKETTGNDFPVDKRTGLDGKKRRVPKPHTAPAEDMPSEKEAHDSWQKTCYDQACLLLDQMADDTRQKFFAYIRRKYRNDQGQE
jgi:hypothetical protein